MKDFVELKRSFRSLSPGSSDDDELQVRRYLKRENPCLWSDLLQEYRVIILSEAGSGKTFEIRNVAESLRREGKQAFFLRLEYVVRDFDIAFEVGTLQEYRSWLHSGGDAWLLLDSIDESRLKDPGDFEFAIRRIASQLAAVLDRVRIVITGRVTAWRPKTDLELCERQFPCSMAVAVSRPSSNDGDFDVDDEADSEALQQDHPPTFKIFALDDLDAEQVEVFARAKGVGDTKAFLDAIERADASAFTTRPQDLEELTEYWISQKQIGGRSQIVENSINRRLAERDQGRSERQKLTADRARTGARTVAAALTLAKEQTVCVPDGADTAQGITVAEILSDWEIQDQVALLLRPIFDEAIYGTARFHHRSVREYLTAEWLSELLKSHTSRRNIESLLFRRQYGLEVVVPTMRPILPWLAIRDEKIQRKLLDVAPELLLHGGDPRQLSLETRRFILRQTCEQIAGGLTERIYLDYSSVQQFARDDLSADIKRLIKKYSASDDVLLFLLRMIWLGELKKAFPEAKAIALSRSTPKYNRIASIKALRAIGSDRDLEEVRVRARKFENSDDPDVLAELLVNVEPASKVVDWLLSQLGTVKVDERRSTRQLIDAVVEFVTRASGNLLVRLVSGIGQLLDSEPYANKESFGISEAFGWLMRPAATAMDRLIRGRSRSCLESGFLTTLLKVDRWNAHEFDDFSDEKFEFEKLVPAWSDLNRSLFWLAIERARERKENDGDGRITEFWQAFRYRSYWSFQSSDFDYAVNEIHSRLGRDDRLVALSLAFRLYVTGGRGRGRLQQLKKAVSGDQALVDRLSSYLKPPRQKGEGRLKRMEAKLKRREEAWRLKEAKSREDWRNFLHLNASRLRESGLAPGVVTNGQYYLLDQLGQKDKRTTRWTYGKWKLLIEEFGEEVATAFRDGAVLFWRRYQPKLRSEGTALNSITNGTVFGLTGLQIEAAETADWPRQLAPDEVDLACRYASFELNGFPKWFPSLFEAFPQAVSEFLLSEIRFELSIESVETDIHYVLADAAWSGKWSWNRLAPSLMSMLGKSEPKNLKNLGQMLTIVQGSSVADADIAKLASRKCRSLKDPTHVARWYAVWCGVDPESAVPHLTAKIEEKLADAERAEFMMTFIVHLVGGRLGDYSSVRAAFQRVSYLKHLYLLTLSYVDTRSDEHHVGVHTPSLRDDAQGARNKLLEMIRSIPGKEAFLALSELGEHHPDEVGRPWFKSLAKKKAEDDADIEKWSPSQVREFQQDIERTPNNHRDLAELAYLRLLDLKDDLENGDSSIAATLRSVGQETDMRKFIGQILRDKSFGRYNIPQEEELADGKKPDLRFHGVGFDGPVPCELKLADKWSGPDLFERLENQLCGDYLRDNRSTRGYFILVCREGDRSWKIPGVTRGVKFDRLVGALHHRWEDISKNYPGVDEIKVVGIDLTKRGA